MPSIQMMSGVQLLCQLFLHHVSLTVPSSDGRFLLSTTSTSLNSHRSLSYCCHLPVYNFLWVWELISIIKTYSLGLCLVHTWSKNLHEIGVCHTQISQEMILDLTWSFLHSPSLFNSHPSKTHFNEAPCSPSSVAFAFRSYMARN